MNGRLSFSSSLHADDAVANKRAKMKGLWRKVSFREEGRKESEIKTGKGDVRR